MTFAKEWGRMNTTVNCIAYGLIKMRLTEAAAGQSTANVEGREIKIGLNPELMAQLERTIPPHQVESGSRNEGNLVARYAVLHCGRGGAVHATARGARGLPLAEVHDRRRV